MPAKFEVKKSGSIGKGLFATTLINKDEQILEFTGSVISFENNPQKIQDQLGNPLQIGPNEYIDIAEPGVLANHSCLPNAGIRNDRFLIAFEDILPGQEILYDYSTTMDEDSWTLDCKCGNSNCRNIITDFKYLPQDLQKKYFELNVVQSFIREKLLVNLR
jgi:uncharacterized protein